MKRAPLLDRGRRAEYLFVFAQPADDLSAHRQPVIRETDRHRGCWLSGHIPGIGVRAPPPVFIGKPFGDIAFDGVRWNRHDGTDQKLKAIEKRFGRRGERHSLLDRLEICRNGYDPSRRGYLPQQRVYESPFVAWGAVDGRHAGRRPENIEW